MYLGSGISLGIIWRTESENSSFVYGMLEFKEWLSLIGNKEERILTQLNEGGDQVTYTIHQTERFID